MKENEKFNDLTFCLYIFVKQKCATAFGRNKVVSIQVKLLTDNSTSLTYL